MDREKAVVIHDITLAPIVREPPLSTCRDNRYTLELCYGLICDGGPQQQPIIDCCHKWNNSCIDLFPNSAYDEPLNASIIDASTTSVNSATSTAQILDSTGEITTSECF